MSRATDRIQEVIDAPGHRNSATFVTSRPATRLRSSVRTVIGVGLVGCGMIGQGHAYALRLLAEDGAIRPIAAADLSLEAAESAQRICPFERIGTDAMAVIDA
jgi:hypothetical protein